MKHACVALFVFASFAACGAPQGPGPTDPTKPPPPNGTGTTTSAGGQACSVDDPRSCPEGQACVVPQGQPSRNGTCQ